MPEPQATPGRGLVLLLLAALTAAPFVAGALAILPAGIAVLVTIVAARQRHAPAVQFGAVVSSLLVLLAIPGGWLTWPLPLLAALGLLAGLRRAAVMPDWAPYARGQGDRRSALLALLFVLGSAGALVGWWWLLQPDLSDASSRIPPVSPLLLAGAGLLFASANALAEELMWRGLAFTAMEDSGIRPELALLLQAVSFGLCHIQGFPRGWIGVGLATIYGLMMGLLRRTSGGLVVPWAAHVCADLVIFSVLAWLALG